MAGMATSDNQGGPTRRTLLTASAVTAAAAVTAPAVAAPAAAAHGGHNGPGSPIKPQAPDRELRNLLREIDPDRIEATINRLVAFGTRHTLSSQDDPVRGIGAARDLILHPQSDYAPPKGGPNTVEKQSIVQPV
jgi:hypothetical protein